MGVKIRLIKMRPKTLHGFLGPLPLSQGTHTFMTHSLSKYNGLCLAVKNLFFIKKQADD